MLEHVHIYVRDFQIILWLLLYNVFLPNFASKHTMKIHTFFYISPDRQANCIKRINEQTNIVRYIWTDKKMHVKTKYVNCISTVWMCFRHYHHHRHLRWQTVGATNEVKWLNMVLVTRHGRPIQKSFRGILWRDAYTHILRCGAKRSATIILIKKEAYGM